MARMTDTQDLESYLAAYVLTSEQGLGRLHTSGVTAEDFQYPDPYAVMRIAETLDEQGEPVTPKSVQQLMKQKGVWEREERPVPAQEWWSDFIGQGQDESGVETAIRYVRTSSTLRDMGEPAEEICKLTQNGHDPTEAIEEARDLTADLLEVQREPENTVLEGSDIGRGIVELLESDERQDIYLPTGFPGLDALIDGFKVGRVNVLAGRSNHGKSLWCDQLMLNVARRWEDEGKRVLKFDLENTDLDLQARLASNLSGVPIRKVQQALQGDTDLAEPHAEKVVKAAGRISDLPITVDSNASADSQYIRSRVRAEQTKGEVGLVIVDYITQMAEPGDSAMEKVMSALSSLHALAKNEDIPVVVVAQINRSPLSAQSPEPQIHHLMWSDELAQKPAQVLMLHSPHAHWEQTESQHAPEPDREELYLFVRKNKGGQGVYEFKFKEDCLRVVDPKDRDNQDNAPF